jgi:hypothetical protein
LASASVIDLIDAKARERQAVWAEPWHPGRTIRLEDLTHELEELYGELRVARSWWPDRWLFMGRGELDHSPGRADAQEAAGDEAGGGRVSLLTAQ